MRIRKKKLTDYGISEERGAELLELAAMKENQRTVCKAASLSNPYLAPYLVKSLQEKVGYDRLFGSMYFRPCVRQDFYGYRRKTLAIIDRLLADMAEEHHKT